MDPASLSWSKRLARVESSTPVTEAGGYQLVLAVALHDPAAGYRSAPQPVKLREIARLPAAVVAWMEKAGELPVRVSPTSQIVVDLRVILGTDAEMFERAAYLQRGTPNWQPVSSV